VVWSQTETSTAEVVNTARVVGGKLIEGTGYGAEEVGKGIKEIGSELSQARGKDGPPKIDTWGEGLLLSF
jgi:hypothetical protein